MVRQWNMKNAFALTAFSVGALSGCVSEYGFQADALNSGGVDIVGPSASPSPGGGDGNPSPSPSPSPSMSPVPGATPTSLIFRPKAGPAKIDLLFVVDNSGSMEDNQRELADSFGLFISEFQKRNVDFHIGIITTDISAVGNAGYWSARVPGYVNPNAGCILTRFPGERYLSQNTANLVSKFQENVRVGTSGSGYEQGLHSVSMALDATRTGPGGCNDGFIRSDALLWVGVFSDENENIQNGESPEARVNRVMGILSQVKGSDSRGYAADFVVDLSTPAPAGTITYPLPGLFEYPEVYLLAADQMKGRKIDIEQSWGKDLINVGSDIIDQAEREFKLTQIPIAGTLVVKVNGTRLTAGAGNGYVYHADRNTVELMGSAATSAIGGTVEISYSYR